VPIYVYKCNKCGETAERMMRMSDPNPTCDAVSEKGDGEVCGGETTKVPARSTFHLKGGGWYRDEYGTGSG